MRFWIWHHGSPVKLTIAPYGSITCHEFEPNEEGFYARSRTYEAELDRLTLSTWERWRDCDGRGESVASYVTSRERLTEIVPTGDIRASHPEIKGWPALDVERVRHRDYAAEAMGY